MALRVGIGSGEGNIITYGNRFCSPRHAEIFFTDGKAAVRDLDSVNGTFVNGRMLTGEHVLKYGDVIYIIGLKIVYLGNVLAINNPKNACAVDDHKLKPIRIESAGKEEEEHKLEGGEAYFLRTPRKLEKLDDETFTIEKCPPKNQQKKQPVIFTIGPSLTMVVPMIAGVLMMGGSGASVAGGLVMSIGAALIGGMWAMLNIRHQNKEELETETARVHSYSTYIAKIAQQILQKIEYNRSALPVCRGCGRFRAGRQSASVGKEQHS